MVVRVGRTDNVGPWVSGGSVAKTTGVPGGQVSGVGLGGVYVYEGWECRVRGRAIEVDGGNENLDGCRSSIMFE